jgi:tRNA(fMet)-specific endonuclease VapC
MAETVMFYSAMAIFPLTEPAIYRYQGLKALKIKIGKVDLCIAAIALEEKAVVVTRNVQDFKKVPDLLIDDWSK